MLYIDANTVLLTTFVQRKIAIAKSEEMVGAILRKDAHDEEIAKKRLHYYCLGEQAFNTSIFTLQTFLQTTSAQCKEEINEEAVTDG